MVEHAEVSGKVLEGTSIHSTAYRLPLHSDLKKEENSFSNTEGSVEQRWSGEQIADFVRKLGFLDTKQEGGDMIRKFLHLNSVSLQDNHNNCNISMIVLLYSIFVKMCC